MPRKPKPNVCAGAGAAFLALAIAGPVAAATWTDPYPLDADRLASLGGGTAIALGRSGNGLFVTRTDDAGSTWKPATFVTSTDSFEYEIAGRRQAVDVAWVNLNSKVRYARSSDGGESFGPSVRLSAIGDDALLVDVTRGPGGLVAVAWVQSGDAWESYDVWVRVSDNGGASFGPGHLVSDDTYDLTVATAIGDDIVYVASGTGGTEGSVSVRTSVNSGASWSPAVTMTTELDGPIVLAAEGSQAVVAFSGFESGLISYRHTRTGGDTWSRRRHLAPPTWFNFDPALALQGGVIRALFSSNCTDDPFAPDCRVYYVRSLDGRSWTAPERVSHAGLDTALVGSVQFAGRVLVTYLGLQENGFHTFVRSRAQ